MSRISPRVTTTLPAKISAKSAEIDLMITDIGLTGSYLKWSSPQYLYAFSLNAPVLLRYPFPGKGEIDQRGTIVRVDGVGLGIQFSELDTLMKHSLWQFIVDHLSRFDACPYCGDKLKGRPLCQKCEWRLDLDAPDYLNYYEKNCTVRRLSQKMKLLDMEQLSKVASFVNIDMMKEPEHDGDSESQDFVGTSPEMMGVFSNIRKVAPTGLSVLILGESGTGKELTAMAIHERSMRKEKAFVAINSAAIPENLLEAELFGYERGAFTGAYASKKGKFEHADGGTLFLDEIGDMPLNLQTKLLRFLQDKTIDRVGGIHGKKIDVRLVAATNQDLRSLVAAGKFRGDLFHRLDEFTIHLPALRERGDDKVILAKFFLAKFNREMSEVKTFTRDAVDAIITYRWPGNVRELINKVRRAIVMSGGSTITSRDLALDSMTLAEEAGGSLSSDITILEVQKIKEALLSTNNNISKAAKLLGVSRPTLYNRLKKHAAFTSLD